MNSLLSSRLYDNRNFYKAFEKDLKNSCESVIIESPFITSKRMDVIFPILCKLRKKGVHIVINTRHPEEHDVEYKHQATLAVYEMQTIGITVLYTGKHHRKLAIIDNKILWEGSLNILSQAYSCEIMRRIDSEELALQLLRFVDINKYL
jgi:phosphatidylserine/phosphatidylglycerophosphate/cardiolipin synthase-like enzyme